MAGISRFDGTLGRAEDTDLSGMAVAVQEDQSSYLNLHS